MKMHILAASDPLFQTCLDIRRTVFIEGQNVPEARERDGLDDGAVHYLFTVDGNAVGCARSRVVESKVKGERFAFLPHARGKGLGKQAMELMLDHYRAHFQGHIFTVSAQLYLKGFYESLGFQPVGEIYPDAGIDHITMIYQD